MRLDELFVPYEQALELKELGLNIDCLAFYNGKFLESTEFDLCSYTSRDIGQCIATPTFSQAFKWFRDNYNFYHSINPLGYNMCLGLVGTLGNLKSCNAGKGHYGTYEEAELECLKAMINLAKKL